MDILPDSMALRYLTIFIGPFFQEDAAVIYAATLSVTKMVKTGPAFLIIWLGLFFSDIWKYWIGWAAIRNERAREFTEKKHVAEFKNKVRSHVFTTLMTARFIPFTRIPAYIACGLFGVNYIKYCVLIAFTAFLYVCVVFSAFHALGSILGEQLMWIMPIAAICVLGIYIAYLLIKNRASKPE